MSIGRLTGLFAIALLAIGCSNNGSSKPEEQDLTASDAQTADVVSDSRVADVVASDTTSVDSTNEDTRAPDDTEVTPSDPCEGITCSGLGTCSAVAGEPMCDCPLGYLDDGEGHCNADPHANSDTVEGSAVAAKNLTILSEEVVAASTWEGDRLKVPIAGQEALTELLNATPFPVVSKAGGQGFLRMVTDLNYTETEIWLDTEPAGLLDAFEEADISIELPLEPVTVDGEDPGDRAEWLKIDLAGTVLMEEKSDNWEIKATILQGGLAFEPKFEVDYTVTPISVEFFRFAAKGTLTGDLLVEVEATGTKTFSMPTKEIVLATKTVWVTVGSIPVSFTPKLKFTYGFDDLTFKGCGRVAAGGKIIATAGGNVQYLNTDKSWTTWDESTFESELYGPEFNLGYFDGQLKGWMRLEASFDVYDIAGPYIKVGPYLDLSYKQTDTSELKLGLEGIIGIKAEAFTYKLIDWEDQFFNWDKSLWSDWAACDNDALAECNAWGSANDPHDDCGEQPGTYEFQAKHDYAVCYYQALASYRQTLGDCWLNAGCLADNASGTAFPYWAKCVANCDSAYAGCLGGYSGPLNTNGDYTAYENWREATCEPPWAECNGTCTNLWNPVCGNYPFD